MEALGTLSNPLRVAIIGSGPSGFYAAEALLDSELNVEIDIFEKLPVPFGLVRFGVAPDHARLKSVCQVFDQIARREQVRFFGNVTLGNDLSVSDFQDSYHATIVATGVSGDRKLGIPGEHLAGVHAASAFVGWYNGHPDHSSLDFDLSQEVVAVVGQGNVSIDVCRILAKPIEELRRTDIARHALDALAASKVREIHVVGRRGPVQAKFTPKELRELGSLPGWRPVVDPDALELNSASMTELRDSGQTNSAKNLEILRNFAARPDLGERHIRFHFHHAPSAIHGASRIERLEMQLQCLSGPAFGQYAEPTDQFMTLPCGLLLRSVGYQGSSLPGLPFDRSKNVLQNRAGRILDELGNALPGWYVAGWIKRGPTGIIGTNRACSIETVMQLLEDLPILNRPRLGRSVIVDLLRQRSARIVSFKHWLAISAVEARRGAELGKVAEKFVNIDDMLMVNVTHQ